MKKKLLCLFLKKIIYNEVFVKKNKKKEVF